MGLSQALDAIQLIHQAFEQGYQGELQRKKQVQDQSLALEANKRANEELQLHKDTTAAQLKSQLAQLEQMHFENKTRMLDLIRSGALPGNIGGQTSLGQDMQGNDIPDATHMTKQPVSFNGETVNDYQLPGEVANQAAEQQATILNKVAPIQLANKVAETTAVGNAETPFANAASARKINEGLSVQAPEIKSREEIARLAQEGENKRTAITAGATIAGHNIEAAAQRYSAQANNFMLPEQQSALISQAQLIAGGAAKLPTGKAAEPISLLLSKSGQTPPDPKDIEKVKAIPMALDTIGMIKDFSKNYGTNSKVQAYLKGKITESDLPTDARAALEAINTRAIPFSKAFEGTQGTRFSVPELKLVINGMVNAGATNPQNKMLSDNLSKVVGLAANSALVRYSPEQREHILSVQGFFDNVPTASSKGAPLDKKTTINNFLKTGKFTPVYN